MLPSTEIPVGISTEDCLAWSLDGELAIAAHEEVYLMLPRHGADSPWTQIHFRVNEFTHQEWPLQRQASFAEMSIGQEQAKVKILSLSWSPPGIAKHKRSVLAVLTSNLLLSLWAPDGDPTRLEGWQRVLIIDNTRIRSMSWAPSCEEIHMLLPTKKLATPLLALSDDKNGMFFMKIVSPYTSTPMPWEGQMIGHEAIQPFHNMNSRPSLFRNALVTQCFIDHIAFGDWYSNGSISITYRSSGVFYQAILAISLAPLQATLSVAKSFQSIAQENQAAQIVPRVIRPVMHEYKEICATSKTNVKGIFLKMWGSARFGNLVAICVTSHPVQMVEYQALSDSTSTVLFADDGPTSNEADLFPWQHEKEIDDSEACQTILLTILDSQLLTSLALTTFDLKIIYAAICATMFGNLSMAHQLPCLEAAESALDLLETRSGGRLQAERDYIIAKKNFKNSDWRNLNHLMNNVVTDSSASIAALVDLCPICEEGHVSLEAAWEGFSEAYCPKRHPFCKLLTSYRVHHFTNKF